jgi:hypothetical protein
MFFSIWWPIWGMLVIEVVTLAIVVFLVVPAEKKEMRKSDQEEEEYDGFLNWLLLAVVAIAEMAIAGVVWFVGIDLQITHGLYGDYCQLMVLMMLPALSFAVYVVFTDRLSSRDIGEWIVVVLATMVLAYLAAGASIVISVAIIIWLVVLLAKKVAKALKRMALSAQKTVKNLRWRYLRYLARKSRT